jgi:hypothetical protein
MPPGDDASRVQWPPNKDTVSGRASRRTPRARTVRHGFAEVSIVRFHQRLSADRPCSKWKGRVRPDDVADSAGPRMASDRFSLSAHARSGIGRRTDVGRLPSRPRRTGDRYRHSLRRLRSARQPPWPLLPASSTKPNSLYLKVHCGLELVSAGRAQRLSERGSQPNDGHLVEADPLPAPARSGIGPRAQ